MLALLLFLFTLTAYALPGEVLYIWNGHAINDFLATVDNDKDSKSYGGVIAKAYLPTSDPKITPFGNQAQQIAITKDGQYAVCLGLLSFTLGTQEVFVFKKNVTTGLMQFAYAADLPGACPSELSPISDTAFIVSQSCSDTGYTPGHLVFFDPTTKEQKVWEKMPTGSTEKFVDFNPLGGDWDKDRGFIVGDWVLPVSLFTNPTVYRDTVRLFGPDGTQKKVFKMPGTPGAGYIAAKWIGDGYAIAAASVSHNEMYLIDTSSGTISIALKLSSINGGAALYSAGIPLVNVSLKKGFIAYGLRYLVLFSWDDKRTFTVLQTYDFCDKKAGYDCTIDPNPGTNHLALSTGGTRITVSNAFLDVGSANFPSRKEVHAFKIASDWKSFTYDLKYDQQTSQSRRGNPRGVASWAK